MPPTVAPRMPMFPPGAANFGQQLFYGQGPPAMFPSQVPISPLHCLYGFTSYK